LATVSGPGDHHSILIARWEIFIHIRIHLWKNSRRTFTSLFDWPAFWLSLKSEDHDNSSWWLISQFVSRIHLTLLYFNLWR
jgi:hypothetical protein